MGIQIAISSSSGCLENILFYTSTTHFRRQVARRPRAPAVHIFRTQFFIKRCLLLPLQAPVTAKDWTRKLLHRKGKRLGTNFELRKQFFFVFLNNSFPCETIEESPLCLQHQGTSPTGLLFCFNLKRSTFSSSGIP